MEKEKSNAVLKEKLEKLFFQQKSLLIFIRNLKEKIKVSEFKLSDLIKENHKLKISVATTLEELIPRPDFTRIFQNLSIEPKPFKNKTSKNIEKEIGDYLEIYIKKKSDIPKSHITLNLPFKFFLCLVSPPSPNSIFKRIQRKYSTSSFSSKNNKGFSNQSIMENVKYYSPKNNGKSGNP